ncbi:hypothetical protein QTI33_08460 [Variovorax sp. J22P271]|uniref:hypothetical protein n=1 Tax=Variovorax davisae TaxID=3053515 RepID=UPI002577277B|nr:hypothetical protein [Variovorax sp. J22P271]MDM0032167.1 hypothetical protein [Variovorax sp. J22P271]
MDNLSDSPTLPITELSDRAHQRAELEDGYPPKTYTRASVPARPVDDVGGARAADRQPAGPLERMPFVGQTAKFVAAKPLQSIGIAAVCGFLFAVALNGLLMRPHPSFDI